MMVRVHPRLCNYFCFLVGFAGVMDDKKRRDLILEKSRKKFRERVFREQEMEFQKLKKDFIEGSLPQLSIEEREKRRTVLLNFVHRYVFINNLASFEASFETDVIREKYFKEIKSTKTIVQKILWLRIFIKQIFSFKSILILSSAFLFFFFEYILHYYTMVSLKDINITFKNIIEKIPPFF